MAKAILVLALLTVLAPAAYAADSGGSDTSLVNMISSLEAGYQQQIDTLRRLAEEQARQDAEARARVALAEQREAELNARYYNTSTGRPIDMSQFPKVSVSAVDMDLGKVLSLLGTPQWRIKVASEVDLSKKVTIRADEVELPFVLDMLVTPLGYTFKFTDNYVYIYGRSALVVTLNQSPELISAPFGSAGGATSSGASADGSSGGQTAVSSQDNVSISVPEMDFWAALAEGLKEYKSEGGLVMINRRDGVLLYEDDYHRVERAKEYLRQSLASAMRQVRVDMDIYEREFNEADDAGFALSRIRDWAHPTNNNDVGITNAAANAATGLVSWAFTNSKYRVIQTMLADYGNIRILSRPHLSLMNRVPGTISSLTSSPYVASWQVTTGVGGAVTQTPVMATAAEGLTVNMMSNIMPNGMVELTLNPSVRDITQWNNFGVAPNTYTQPTVKERTFVTKHLIPANHGVIIGGLFTSSFSSSRGTVPGINRIPLIGDMTSSRNIDAQQVELIFVVRVSEVTTVPYAFREQLPEGRVMPLPNGR